MGGAELSNQALESGFCSNKRRGGCCIQETGIKNAHFCPLGIPSPEKK